MTTSIQPCLCNDNPSCYTDEQPMLYSAPMAKLLFPNPAELRKRRLGLGLSQAAVASKVREMTGQNFSQQALAKYETGKNAKSKFGLHIMFAMDELSSQSLSDGCQPDGVTDYQSGSSPADSQAGVPPPRLPPDEQELYALAEALSRDELIEYLATAAAILSQQDQIELAERLLRGVREDLASG